MSRTLSIATLLSLGITMACSAGDGELAQAGNSGAAGGAGGGGAGGSTAGSSATGGAGGSGATVGSGGSGGLGATGGLGAAGGSGGSGGNPGCIEGDLCDPILIETYPFTDSRSTLDSPSQRAEFAAYDCAASTDESGPEWFYEVSVSERGILDVSVSDGAGVDVDVQLLSSLDAASCLARGDTDLTRTLDPGSYFLVVDTWVDSSGTEFGGSYDLAVDFTPVAQGACATTPLDLKMFWSSCASGIDCFEGVDPGDGQTYRWLRTPAVGPVVKEAHLVTVMDDFGGGWPSSFTDKIAAHYSLSEAATGYSMNRSEPWAPAGEGGSEYGQGSTSTPLPVIEEAWYVNMYWRDRPAKGTRMIVRNPVDGRAVVAAAGYETGPGDPTRIGGASEEIHDHLGAGHLVELEMGFAVDQSLSFGPIDCQ